MLVFTGVYVCVKAKLTLVSFFFPFFLHLSLRKPLVGLLVFLSFRYWTPCIYWLQKEIQIQPLKNYNFNPSMLWWDECYQRGHVHCALLIIVRIATKDDTPCVEILVIVNFSWLLNDCKFFDDCKILMIVCISTKEDSSCVEIGDMVCTVQMGWIVMQDSCHHILLLA